MTPAGRFLVEGIVWRWDLSGVKTLNLTFVVRKSDDGASALLLRASDPFGGVNLFFFFFTFLLCAALMSRLSLNIFLLQRLGVFWYHLGINIFPLSKKYLLKYIKVCMTKI
jgi:hypothetical protein